MAFASILTRASLGVEAPQVQVEVHASNGLPALNIVGLPEASVKESKERVRSAILNSGFQLPPKRITVNLAPADLPKSGGRYDVAIALGILIATEQLQVDVSNCEFFGELGLNGEVRRIPGVLPAVIQSVQLARKAVVPADNLEEAQLAVDSDSTEGTVLGASSLLELCSFVLGKGTLPKSTRHSISATEYPYDLSDVVGQAQAKRVLELSAVGGHSILMVGSPGSGKSMLASRLITLLPELSWEQAIERASVQSVSGKSLDAGQFFQRQIINPHHTASAAAMVGGGTFPKPGAVSLAHHGLLFLDELPEFSRHVLEALREPLESHRVEISRVNHQVSFPAKFLLVAAMNPTPSGYFPDDPHGRCKDTPEQILRYQKKISGPLLDRIDLHIEVPPVDIDALQNRDSHRGESSLVVRERVTQLHELQMQRQGCLNGELTPTQIQQLILIDDDGKKLLQSAVEKMGISARSYHRVLRVSRSLADMAGSDRVESEHLAEALGYRSFDRNSGRF
ncbi:YifB family Mg chelatase-like AAA ATPase [Thiomicrorhabdus sp.]|uniref:YifB family Mg chelatase-like AAA ATPase n=1 Tax=Thiomicrorhabdus sp. TaxID=2039724 RepID=UPI0035641A75